MSLFWVSWWAHPDHKFEYPGPWWVSGMTVEDDIEYMSICAAVSADSEEDARRKIIKIHDPIVASLDFRFIDPRPDNWSPFSSRFQKADWMKWPPPT